MHSSAPITEKMVAEEVSQVERTGLHCYRYGFFSRSGLMCTPNSSTLFIELDEMY